QRAHDGSVVSASPRARVAPQRVEGPPFANAPATGAQKDALEDLVQPGLHVRSRLERARECHGARGALLNHVLRLGAATRQAASVGDERRKVPAQALTDGLSPNDVFGSK